MIWSGRRLHLCPSPPYHINRFGGFSLNKVNFVIPFVIFNTFFLSHIQICMSRPNNINVFQVEYGMFLLSARRAELQVRRDVELKLLLR